MHTSSRFLTETMRFVSLAALVIAIGILPVPGAIAQTGDATSFRSNGDLIAGWYWLRDRGLNHHAEYTFAYPPKQGDILLGINALATDRINGGPGVNAEFNLLVGFPGSGRMGGVFHRIRVTLPNVSSPGDPAGYMTSGKVRLERGILDRVIPASGEIFIRIVRAEASGPHVAFRPDSVRLYDGGGARSGSDGPARNDGGAATKIRPNLGDEGQ